MHEHESLTAVNRVRADLKKKKKKSGIFPQAGNPSCHVLELKKWS